MVIKEQKDSELRQSPLKARRVTAISKLVAALGLAALIAGCSGTPGPEDIEPYVQNDVGSCPLWTITNVKKTDGAAEGSNYRLDFSAELTLKGSSEETGTIYRNQGSRPEFKVCHPYVPHLASREGPGFGHKFVIEGFAIFTKTEKGWRLIRNWTPTTIMPS